MGWQDAPLENSSTGWKSAPIVDEDKPSKKETGFFNDLSLKNLPQNAANLGAGLIRGAGSIGASIGTLGDILTRANMPIKDYSFMKADKATRQGMDSGFESMGVDTKSGGYAGGKIIGEIAGTAGAGNLLAIPAQAAKLPLLANALKSGGFSLGGTTGNIGLNALTRVAGGAGVGAGSVAMVDPENTATGAAIGAALPAGVKIAGSIGGLIPKAIAPYTKKGQDSRVAKKLMEVIGDSYKSVIPQLKNASGMVAGFMPKTGQATQNADLATMARVMEEANTEFFRPRNEMNRLVHADAIRAGGGDDIALQRGIDARAEAADGFYNLAKSSNIPETAELKELLARPAIKNAMGYANVNLANSGKKSIVGESVGDYPLIDMSDLDGIPMSKPLQQTIDGELVSGGQGKTLTQQVRKMGGINLKEIQDILGEKTGKKAKTSVGFFNKNGQDSDDLAGQLSDLGYIPQDEMAVDGGVSFLKEAIRRENNGEKVYALADAPFFTKEQTITQNFAEDSGAIAPSYFDNKGNPVYSGQSLHEAKLALDKMSNINPINAADAASRAGIINAKNDFNNYLDSNIPYYEEAKKTFKNLSAPINKMEVWNSIRDRFIPASDDLNPIPKQLNYANLAKISNRDGDALAQKVTGFKGARINTVLRDSIKNLKDVVSDSQYIRNGLLNGKPANSSSYQNMVFDAKASGTGASGLLDMIPLKGATVGSLKAIRNIVYEPANKATKEKFLNSLLDPKEAARIIELEISKADKVKMLSKLRPSGVYGGAAGLLGSD